MSPSKVDAQITGFPGKYSPEIEAQMKDARRR
jgi:hypothetical protein